MSKIKLMFIVIATVISGVCHAETRYRFPDPSSQRHGKWIVYSAKNSNEKIEEQYIIKLKNYSTFIKINTVKDGENDAVYIYSSSGSILDKYELYPEMFGVRSYNGVTDLIFLFEDVTNGRFLIGRYQNRIYKTYNCQLLASDLSRIYNIKAASIRRFNKYVESNPLKILYYLNDKDFSLSRFHCSLLVR